ncbi:MAG: adenylate/guanylate cyclase domain-containing protein [Acidimicrobiia bacterium]
MPTRTQRRQIVAVLAISVVGGALFGVIALNGTRLVAAGEGALAGLLVPSILITIQFAIRGGRLNEWLFQKPFGVSVLVGVGLSLAGIVLALGIVGWVFDDEGVNAIPALIFSVAASVGFTVWFALDRLLGGGVLPNLLRGYYRRPREENTVFLFADVVGSVELARRLGSIKFHELLNHLFFELAIPIEQHFGTIRRYIGDEVMVTWPLRAAAGADPVQCAIDLLAVVERRASQFEENFGAAPRLRIAMHCGPVVVGEMGDLKREIVYTGDTVNTTARIEGAAKELGAELVVSADIAESVGIPAGATTRALGSFTLKGRDEAIELIAIDV